MELSEFMSCMSIIADVAAIKKVLEMRSVEGVVLNHFKDKINQILVEFIEYIDDAVVYSEKCQGDD